ASTSCSVDGEAPVSSAAAPASGALSAVDEVVAAATRLILRGGVRTDDGWRNRERGHVDNVVAPQAHRPPAVEARERDRLHAPHTVGHREVADDNAVVAGLVQLVDVEDLAEPHRGSPQPVHRNNWPPWWSCRPERQGWRPPSPLDCTRVHVMRAR